MSNLSPLLTISIPTWERAEYLRLNLAQLEKEIGSKVDKVEVLVSDNFSSDDTKVVVEDAIARGMIINYIRNPVNIGSDHNIAQCFNKAAGEYVLILGDDDILVDGALDKLLSQLDKRQYGVVFLRPYGYENDFRAERPVIQSSCLDYSDSGAFIAKIGALAGLISSNVINKKALLGEDASQYCGTSLVQTYLVYAAAIKVGRNLYMNEYLLAYKRNNWGHYSFFLVFVDRFWAAVDYFSVRGLNAKSVKKLARNMLLGYYPFYVFKMRLKSTDSSSEDYQRLHARFSQNGWFWIMIAPQFLLPKPLALMWGGMAVLIGRVLMGDAHRGLSFAYSWLTRTLWKK